MNTVQEQARLIELTPPTDGVTMTATASQTPMTEPQTFGVVGDAVLAAPVSMGRVVGGGQVGGGRCRLSSSSQSPAVGGMHTSTSHPLSASRCAAR